ncbi:unnamed protein product [Cyprideis torosa]|uniref:Uncharacterized protein n=1 Tax=Cyprideis torosa TaxID=163714 RepID=A0A7R8ZVU2_9CRUS|nr:unnamed protein product [Cyprideis torosa]CAG0904065.1 unnamed protein product [Cyprideis torosa]
MFLGPLCFLNATLQKDFVDEGERQTQSKATDGREFHFLKSPALVFLASHIEIDVFRSSHKQEPRQDTGNGTDPYSASASPDSSSRRSGNIFRSSHKQEPRQDTGNGTDPYSASASPDSSSR